MLLKQSTLKAIATGKVTVAFRRWRRPTVRAGGTLLTTIGVLSIDDVSPVDLDEITESDARAAGHKDLQSLRAMLAKRTNGTIYRIAFHHGGPDPRLSLRNAIPSLAELEELRSQMVRWDASSSPGPWTQSVLKLLRKHPGVRAADVADKAGMDRRRFKANVRKLKALGLTESLAIGYRLSPRGEAFLRHVLRSS